jgi:hypothetical protein
VIGFILQVKNKTQRYKITPAEPGTEFDPSNGKVVFRGFYLIFKPLRCFYLEKTLKI